MMMSDDGCYDDGYHCDCSSFGFLTLSGGEMSSLAGRAISIWIDSFLK
jgi:hypothetical protein